MNWGEYRAVGWKKETFVSCMFEEVTRKEEWFYDILAL
jgi:hypothetical protein